MFYILHYPPHPLKDSPTTKSRPPLPLLNRVIGQVRPGVPPYRSFVRIASVNPVTLRTQPQLPVQPDPLGKDKSLSRPCREKGFHTALSPSSGNLAVIA